MEYRLTYACFPHPLYAGMKIEADDDKDALREARALIRGRQVGGWYFNEENVEWKDVELREVRRPDDTMVLAQWGTRDDVVPPGETTPPLAPMRRLHADPDTKYIVVCWNNGSRDKLMAAEMSVYGPFDTVEDARDYGHELHHILREDMGAWFVQPMSRPR